MILGSLLTGAAKTLPLFSAAFSGFKNVLSSAKKDDLMTSVMKSLDIATGIGNLYINNQLNTERAKIMQSLLDAYGTNDTARAQQLADAVSSSTAVGGKGTVDQQQSLQLNIARLLQEQKGQRAPVAMAVLQMLESLNANRQQTGMMQTQPGMLPNQQQPITLNR